MNKLKSFVLILGITFGIGLLAPVGAYAESAISGPCAGVTGSSICDKKDATTNSLIKTVINVLLYIVGAVSLIMLIVGGLLYTTSAGDSGRVTTAKNTITYAIVGLVVAILAFAVVNFVLLKFFK